MKKVLERLGMYFSVFTVIVLGLAGLVGIGLMFAVYPWIAGFVLAIAFAIVYVEVELRS